MIRQNRAVPVLLVLTIAWVLYLGGCFGTQETTTADEAEPTTVVATPTPEPVVSEDAAAAAAELAEAPFEHTIEQGDLLSTIAAKYNVSTDVIVLANPGLNPNLLIVGQTLKIPGATTDNTALGDPVADREPGESSNYVVKDGDLLGTIAELYTVSLDALLEANPGVDPQTLQVGALLTIPPFGTGLSPEALAAQATTVPVERELFESQFHTVEPGDLLSTLAALYSVTVDEIMLANSLGNPNEILVGQELVIPPPSITPAPDESPAATAVPEPTAAPTAAPVDDTGTTDDTEDSGTDG